MDIIEERLKQYEQSLFDRAQELQDELSDYAHMSYMVSMSKGEPPVSYDQHERTFLWKKIAELEDRIRQLNDRVNEIPAE